MQRIYITFKMLQRGSALDLWWWQPPPARCFAAPAGWDMRQVNTTSPSLAPLGRGWQSTHPRPVGNYNTLGTTAQAGARTGIQTTGMWQPVALTGVTRVDRLFHVWSYHLTPAGDSCDADKQWMNMRHYEDHPLLDERALPPQPRSLTARLVGQYLMCVVALSFLGNAHPAFAGVATDVTGYPVPAQAADPGNVTDGRGGGAPVPESTATLVETLQKQIQAQQALLQALQDRMNIPSPPSAGGPGTGEASPSVHNVKPAGDEMAGGAGSANGVATNGGTQPAPAAVGAVAPSPDTRDPADAESSAPGDGAAQGRQDNSAFHLPDGTGMTTQQRMAYASGVSVWREIENAMNAHRSLGINLDPRYVMLGLKDMATRSPLKMSRDAIDTVTLTLNQLYMQKSQEVRDLQKTQGSAYRVAFSKQKGSKIDAGSWYEVISRGTGKSLRTTDVVNLLVTGTLPDGTVFDASGQSGQVKTAKVGALLPAVAIGLQKIAPGGHIKVVVPPEKGYGDAGLPPAIPGGATLIFDIAVQGLADGSAR